MRNGMRASDRVSEKKEVHIEKIDARLPSIIKSHILTFLGIGTKSFKPRVQPFKDKTGKTQFPTFYGNLFVLCTYMDRAKLTATIAMNLLWHFRIEETLTLAKQNKKCLSIPVLIKDPHGQWLEATPLQAACAAGDFDLPNKHAEAKNFGLAGRLRSCFENPAHADKQLAAWTENWQESTETTMAPYVAAINNTCKQIIECKEISDDISWETMLALPIFLQIDEDFKKALVPNSNHIVRSGFLFSMTIFLHLIETFQANTNNDNIEDKSHPNLGGWWSRKSTALEVVIYPKLQARTARCDLAIFKAGISHVVSENKIPARLDFSNGIPVDLTDVGATLLFGFDGKKYNRQSEAEIPWGGFRSTARATEFFKTCIQQKHQQLGICGPSQATLIGRRYYSVG